MVHPTKRLQATELECSSFRGTPVLFFIHSFLLLLFSLLTPEHSFSASGGTYLSELQELASENDPEAMFALALFYEYGSVELQPDKKQALHWFIMAAEKKVAAACLYLGLKYEFGAGVQQDLSRAAYNYCLAAEQGWPDAQFHLAELYSRGKGVRKDPCIALGLLTLAEKELYPMAEERKKQLLQEMGESLRSAKKRCFEHEDGLVPDCR